MGFAGDRGGGVGRGGRERLGASEIEECNSISAIEFNGANKKII